MLLIGASLLLPACPAADPEPKIFFQYMVRGAGDDVRVNYYAGSGQLVEETMVEEVVSLPWTSDEYEGDSATQVRIEADGPEGAVVECVVRYREESKEYGGNGAGQMAQTPSSPSDDQTACSIDQPLVTDP